MPLVFIKMQKFEGYSSPFAGDFEKLMVYFMSLESQSNN
jgi:hypothetical protein